MVSVLTVSVCVCQKTTLISTSAFIHKQKDHSVLKLSSVLHGCLHELVKLRKANVGLQKKHLQR